MGRVLRSKTTKEIARKAISAQEPVGSGPEEPDPDVMAALRDHISEESSKKKVLKGSKEDQ